MPLLKPWKPIPWNCYTILFMKNFYSKVTRRLANLPRFHNLSDFFLFSRIFLFAAVVPLLMRLPLPRLHSLLRPRKAPSVADPARVQQIALYVDAAIQLGKPLIQHRCLIRGLTLYFFLSRAGLDVELCFGVGSQEDNHPGHCWLVRDGEPYLEPQDPLARYKPFYHFPAYRDSST